MAIELTSELRRKFAAFREAYLEAERRLIELDVQGAVIAKQVWEDARSAVPLTPDELILYKKLVAMHSVNGGVLFEND